MFLLLFPLAAHSSPISNKGYLETRFSYLDSAGASWQTTQRFRSTTEIAFSELLSLEITPQISFTQGRYEFGEYLSLLEKPLQEELGQGLNETIEDCEWDLEQERTINELSDVLTIPRLFLDLQTDAFDLRIGTQALNWGVGQFFNPSNILSENLLSTPWQERTGLHAVKSTIPLQKEQELKLIISTQDFVQDSSFLTGIYSRNLKSTDLSFVSSSNILEKMFGVNIKGDAKVGYWIETAYRFSNAVDNGIFGLSSGIDYSIPIRNGLVISTQFSYDSSGETDPKYYDWKSRQPLEFFLPDCAPYPVLHQEAPETQRQTLGRLYTLNTLQLFWNEDWSTQILYLLNLHDQTGLLYPNTKLIIGSHWQINTGIQFLLGNDGEFAPNIDSLPINSDELIPRWTSISWLRYSL